MISYKDALSILLDHVTPLASEEIFLSKASKRILAEDVFYDVNMPPFDKSAMDGYACRREDLANELAIVEVIFAGKQPEKSIAKDECAKIMTGAVVPEGADCVFMVEHSKMQNEHQVICTNDKTNTNICYKAEDVKIGDLALSKGTLLRPQHLPILAGAGIHKPKVFSQPKITLFATGTELVEPHEKPLPHQIRNSNSSQMLAQLSELGLHGMYEGIIKDDKLETEEKISNAFKHSDILMMSGGVSVGDYDFIPETIQKMGFEILLEASAIQPGKPILVAKKGQQFCFGLAGNPVSSFVQFNVYIKPFLNTLMGFTDTSTRQKGFIEVTYQRKKTNRLKFIPAHINENHQVSPVEFHGSAHIHALAQANCLLEIPFGVGEINKGDSVYVRPI